jgi:hypothetical protein
MKYLACMFVAAIGLNSACAQTTHSVWKATVTVLNEAGLPVAGANVEVGYYIKPPLGESEAGENIHGLTDTNGIFTASHENTGSIDLGFRASKDGYYDTTKEHEFAAFRDSDLEKLSPHVVLYIKRVIKPIAMFARAVDSEPLTFKKTGRPPIVFTNSIGYDLMAGDWVAPYGKGANIDITFTEAFNKKSIMDYDYKLTLSFPKPGDGIQEFTVPDVEKGSALRSPHDAPTNGYNAQLVRENFHHPGQAGQADYDPNRNYFFRVRTVLDHEGNVVSAHYGKIYGDPEQMNFQYYFNPTPSDRNIEFDPKQNLLGGLQSFEGVSAP